MERTDGDDLAATLLTHGRQDRLEHAEDTEHIRFKLCPRVIQAVFFERTSLSVARIVHEQIDAPCSLQDGLDACLDRDLRADVERKHFIASSRVVYRSTTGAEHLKAVLRQ